MFHLNDFRLRSSRPVQMGRCWLVHFRSPRPDGARAEGVVAKVQQAELKAGLCQPVV